MNPPSYYFENPPRRNDREEKEFENTRVKLMPRSLAVLQNRMSMMEEAVVTISNSMTQLAQSLREDLESYKRQLEERHEEWLKEQDQRISDYFIMLAAAEDGMPERPIIMRHFTPIMAKEEDDVDMDRLADERIALEQAKARSMETVPAEK